MAEIKDLDPTDGNNTSIGGINSQGNTVPSNMDNILRAVAGMLARMNDGTAPLEDTFTLADPADPTKQGRFDMGNVTAGQKRVVTFPDADVTIPSSYYAPAGTDVALADGGTGASLTDPNADRIFFWDDSAGSTAWLVPNTGLAISGTNLSMSFLGLEALTDPNADRIAFWDDSEGAFKWLGLGTGLAISTTTLGLSLSAITYTDAMAWLIPSPTDSDYRVVVKIPFGGTITEVVTRSTSGTCTLTVKVNTTALGGTANSVSTSEQAQAHASTNTFAADDDIVLTVSSNSSCLKMSVTIKYTRALG